ncbi:MAG: hypothetical protein ACHQZR_07715 [Candidatus Limnocylindrales bacterium]
MSHSPSWVPLLVGVLLALVGLVWIGQGTGLIGGSAMSGATVWAVVGLVALVAGGALAAWGTRRRT